MDELKIVTLENGDIYIPLINFDKWEDFLLLISAIKGIVKPDIIQYGGITDMSGHFIKQNQRVGIEYDSMTGNGIIIRKEDINSDSIFLVNEWIRQIISYCHQLKK